MNNVNDQGGNEVEIDLLDLVKTLLSKWKLIFLIVIIFGILGGVLGAYKEAQPKPTREDVIESMAEVLDEDETADVIWYASRYAATHNAKRRFMMGEYSDWLTSYQNADISALVAEYYIDSTIPNVGFVFDSPLIDESVTRKLREVSPEESMAPVTDRVLFTLPYDYEGASVNVGAKDEAGSKGVIITLGLYAPTREECQGMLEIMDEVIAKEIEDLKAADPNIKYEKISARYSNDAGGNDETIYREWGNRVRTRVTQYDTLLAQIKKETEELTSDQKNYYEKLVDVLLENEDDGLSWKKMAVICAFIGGVLICGILFLIYMFNGKVKTDGEVSGILGASVLRRFTTSEKKKGFEEGTEMAVSELQCIAEKKEMKSIFFLCDAADDKAKDFAERIAGELSDDGKIKVVIGNPVSDAGDLKAFDKSDAAVAFVQPKKTLAKTLKNWKDLCRRYEVDILGSMDVFG